MSYDQVNIDRINRVTAAIAALPPEFTRRDVMRESGLSVGGVSAYIQKMEKTGWFAVYARLPGGAKIWHKTAQYHAPTRAALSTRQASAVAAIALRAGQAVTLDVLGKLLSGWTVTNWPPKGYSAGELA